MNGIVIYKSRYGAAKQYAQWIGEALKVSVKDMDEVSIESLAAYDYVIAGSSIYMGKILMKGWLAKNEKALNGKKLFLFIVGAAPSSEIEKTEKYFTDNISQELLLQNKHYYLQGKSVFQELSWLDKFFLKMGARLAKEERDKKAMLTDFNAIRRENLTELLKEVESFKS